MRRVPANVTRNRDGEVERVEINVGEHIPCFVVVFNLEDDPYVVGNIDHVDRLVASLNDEWKEVLLRAIESTEDTWP